MKFSPSGLAAALILSNLLFCRFATAQTTAQPQEIFTLDAFSLQQACVQYCFTTSLSGCTTDVLGEAIGCAIDPCSNPFQAVDSCYCREDLQSEAQSFLASCVKESCTVGDASVNMANAGSIYGGYCTSKGYTAFPAQNPATTTSNDGAASTADNSRTGTTASSTDALTGSLDLVSSTASSINHTVSIALGVVSGVTSIVILTAGALFWKSRHKKVYPSEMNLPYIHRRPVVSEASSAEQFRLQVGNRLSDDARTIYPTDSASVVNQPTSFSRSYPRYPANLPSLVSTNLPAENNSKTINGRNHAQY